jgi:hypothetical protein
MRHSSSRRFEVLPEQYACRLVPVRSSGDVWRPRFGLAEAKAAGQVTASPISSATRAPLSQRPSRSNGGVLSRLMFDFAVQLRANEQDKNGNPHPHENVAKFSQTKLASFSPRVGSWTPARPGAEKPQSLETSAVPVALRRGSNRPKMRRRHLPD